MTDPGVLETREIEVDYAGVVALDGVSLRLQQGEILGLIGPNGAGKTTMVNVLTGFTRPDKGSIIVDGRDVTGLAPHRLARLGVVRTFQAVRLFEELSIRENVALGALGAGLGRREADARAERLLESAGLGPRQSARHASGLPHGLARVVGVLRALAGTAQYVLLDEPAAGLNEAEGRELVGLLGRIPSDFGCGLLVIEHDMHVIMSLCQRIHVLDYGKTLRVGTPAQVQEDASVRAAYLGTRRAAPPIEA